MADARVLLKTMWRPYCQNGPILLLLILLMLAKGTLPVSEDGPLPCGHSHESAHRELERCFHKGTKFITRYLNSIRRGRHNYDKCEGLEEFSSCLEPLVSACPELVPAVEEVWGPVLRQLHCACNGTQVCMDTLECLEDQYGGVLSRRCDAYYRFNVQQRTRDKCRFLAENIRCKQALMSSGCGQDEVARGLSALSFTRTSRNAGCGVALSMEEDEEYEGFAFDEACPTSLASRLEACQAKHLRSRQRLLFHSKNDLIIDGSVDDVDKGCKNYHDYVDCMSPLKEKCPVGTAMLLQHESRLRTYIMKLGYICDRAFQDYTSNMDCYREVVSHQNLTECDYIFVTLKPILQKVTAYQFYCKPQEEGSADLARHLDHLRQCYEDVFSRSCNGTGGSAMSGLIREVFNDPFYLRYKYRPDCALHSIVDPTTPRYFRSADRTGRDRLTASGCRLKLFPMLIWIIVFLKVFYIAEDMR